MLKYFNWDQRTVKVMYKLIEKKYHLHFYDVKDNNYLLLLLKLVENKLE